MLVVAILTYTFTFIVITREPFGDKENEGRLVFFSVKWSRIISSNKAVISILYTQDIDGAIIKVSFNIVREY